MRRDEQEMRDGQGSSEFWVLSWRRIGKSGTSKEVLSFEFGVLS